MRRSVFWIALALLAFVSALVTIRFFPRAFSLVALDITMDRERALSEAQAVVAREGLGPPGYRQAASFGFDDRAQTFIELEGGGKEAFTAMIRDGLYSAYTWRVRHFKEGETNETTVRFTPEGRAYGFIERLREDAPGPALEAEAARQIAETSARRWNADLAPFALVEQGQERRVSGRVDHTLTYERASPVLNEGRYRLRLVVSGDRLTELTHFIRIPEAFSRRYQNMRSANDAIGIGSVVGMALLYVVGGIGVGLFYLLRKRWVLWRTAAIWGAVVGFLQALSTLNDLPLLWMTYDTAIARSTFLGEFTARAVAAFFGFSVFFALSFMAAESLTRRAFGHHPQLWRLWSARPSADGGGAPGASITALGATIGGYLLVPVFLAFVVMFYFVANRYLGWWSPSESLLHPDVLATYIPWLSAIANSLQAGFWEEALFRAIPLAGAALIGERLGQRRLFLVAAFVVQALIFGAGHAQYPGQPAYARPVELIVPSIGFGLLYVFFGLLPAVVLHFTFDVVLFALPIFLASAPGIWVQKLMVVIVALVPLWVVLWRRVQARRWTELSPGDRNAAWRPPTAVEPDLETVSIPHLELGARTRTVWLAVGAVSAIVCAAAGVAAWTRSGPSLAVTRAQAIEQARSAIEQRGTTLERKWRFLTAPENGAQGAHEFVSTTAGEERRRELLGRYLGVPRWRVRVATFEGDVADRAEEWNVFVGATGDLRDVHHQLPEGRAGARVDEAAARDLARKAVADRYGLEESRGQIKEVSNRPARLNARTDWTFTFADTTIAPLPEGEPRITAVVAGDEVASVGRFVFVPEHWQRSQRAANTRNLILRIGATMVLAGLLLAAAVQGVIAWSRRRYAPRLFVAGTLVLFVVAVAKNANNWPQLLISLPTAAPLEVQLLGVTGLGLVGLILSSALAGLALGALPHRLTGLQTLPERDALRLGFVAGLFAAAIALLAALLRSPAWASLPNLASAGAMVPMLQTALDPLTRVLMATATLAPALIIVDQVTSSWTRRRVVGLLILLGVGAAGGGAPIGVAASGWIGAASLTAGALTVAYVTLLRFDLSMVPIALATMIAVGSLVEGAGRAYPGALGGSALGALLSVLLGWWWFRALRRARARVADDVPAEAAAV